MQRALVENSSANTKQDAGRFDWLLEMHIAQFLLVCQLH
jgi:hypothetical protein